MRKPTSHAKTARTHQAAFPFEGPNLLQVAMPMGGIGAGNISLNGYGGLQDFSVRNRPFLSALPDDWTSPWSHLMLQTGFGILRLPETGVTKLAQGPIPPEKIYHQGLYGQGYQKGGAEGMPRFLKAEFAAEYPFGHVTLSDPEVPLGLRITGFSPLIPLDDRNSGLPCAILEYRLHNPTAEALSYELSFHLAHLAIASGVGREVGRGGECDATNTVLEGKGVHFTNSAPADSEEFGSACLMALKGRVAVKGMWFRGGWFDTFSALWREVSSGRFRPNAGSNGIDTEGRTGGSILFRGRIAAGAEVTCPLVIAWHFPNARYDGTDPGPQPRTSCCATPEGPLWHPHYSTLWSSAREVAEHVARNYRSLRARTETFKSALFSSTVPRPVLDAVASNLAILKSSTVLRLEDGTLWGWEGCFASHGCCHGSCTHVWNYAQAICHLFPALERTLRENEYRNCMDDQGHVNFRAWLPMGPADHTRHAAADGQLGGLMKLHRDWHISGDTEWMARLFPMARKSLEYAIQTWDPDRRGALFEPHHNTYDIEFWGPDGMCTTIYLGALCAMAEMGEALGLEAEAASWRELAERGARFLETELFNGEYFHQQVQFRELRDPSFRNLIADDSRQGEAMELLRREGPKYQYGDGCLSDGVIGCWMAELYGIATPIRRDLVRLSLQAIFKHNFLTSMRRHVNTQRAGYAIGEEPGLLLCSWPRGRKPTLPFVYSDEVWTGIEYQVASHLILEGFVEEGLQVVQAARSRYDGRTRNPFNEYECGNFYARAMASYALLPAYGGFRYSALDRTFHLAPRARVRPFVSFFSTDRAWGTFTLERDSLRISVAEGALRVDRLAFQGSRKSPLKHIPVRKTARPGAALTIQLG